jgi:hypothetical protein
VPYGRDSAIGKLPTSHLGCKHVRPCGERIFLHLRKHRTRVPTLQPDSQYSESYPTSIRHLVKPSSWVCHRYPPPLEFLQRQPTWPDLAVTWQARRRLYILKLYVVVWYRSWRVDVSPYGHLGSPHVGDSRCWAKSSSGLGGGAARQETPPPHVGFLHSLEMGLWRGVIRNQEEESMSACEKVGS